MSARPIDDVLQELERMVMWIGDDITEEDWKSAYSAALAAQSELKEVFSYLDRQEV